MTRSRHFHGTVIPSAARWEIHTCGHCPNIHLILFDDNNRPFAEVIFGAQNHKAFYERGLEMLTKLRQDNVRRQNEEGSEP